jgi:hypothetical protein
MKRFFAFIVLIVTIVVFAGVGFADDPFTTRPHTWTDKNYFNSDVTFRDKITYGSGVQIYQAPIIVDLAGTSYYNIDPAKGSLFWINDHESTRGTRVSSGVSIILPKITPDLHNYIVKIQKMTYISGVSLAPLSTSSTTPVVITTKPWAGTSGTTDGLWNVTSGVTRQSATGLIMPEIIEIDATGDYLVFIALYNATSGSTWYQIDRYIQ